MHAALHDHETCRFTRYTKTSIFDYNIHACSLKFSKAKKKAQYYEVLGWSIINYNIRGVGSIEVVRGRTG